MFLGASLNKPIFSRKFSPFKDGCNTTNFILRNKRNIHMRVPFLIVPVASVPANHYRVHDVRFGAPCDPELTGAKKKMKKTCLLRQCSSAATLSPSASQMTRSALSSWHLVIGPVLSPNHECQERVTGCNGKRSVNCSKIAAFQGPVIDVAAQAVVLQASGKV